MENNEGYNPSEEEKEIDLLDLFRKLLKRKKTIGIWCLVGLVLGLVVAFSLPREYTTSLTLA
ncbi:MAG: chain-length determining protein, partial [Muribaculaceae bacterium]|nr:chain-length determining protein [Muribaculaceae bacterium]